MKITTLVGTAAAFGTAAVDEAVLELLLLMELCWICCC
jgi:hypothetical protein